MRSRHKSRRASPPPAWREGQVHDPSTGGRPAPHQRRQIARKAQQPEGAGAADDYNPLARMQAVDLEICALIERMHPRHVIFARCLSEASTQEQASIAAGYSKSQGSRLSAEPDVARLVDLLLELDALSSVHVRKPALRLAMLEIVRDKTSSAADRVKATALIARMEGLDRVQIEVAAQAVGKDPAELQAVLAEKLARVRGETTAEGSGDSRDEESA